MFNVIMELNQYCIILFITVATHPIIFLSASQTIYKTLCGLLLFLGDIICTTFLEISFSNLSLCKNMHYYLANDKFNKRYISNTCGSTEVYQ